MKHRLSLLLIFAWAILTLGCSGGTKQGVAAKVDDKTITIAEVTKVARNFRNQNMNPDPEAQGTTPAEKLYYTAVDRLVEQTLILEEAQKLGIQVSDTEVTSNIDQLVTMAGGDAKLDSLLAQQGATRADVEKDMRNNLILKGYLDHVRKNVPAVTDSAVMGYYGQHPEMFGPPAAHARHVLIRASANSSEAERAEARQKAQTALNRAKSGESFEKIASEMSQDEGSAMRGGDLGWFAKGAMVGPFDAAVFSLKPGELSGLVETEYGYHVIKAEEISMDKGVPVDQVREQIRQYLNQEETTKYFKNELASLKAKAKVKIEPPTPAVLDSLQRA